jgi:hypothetical protein
MRAGAALRGLVVAAAGAVATLAQSLPVGSWLTTLLMSGGSPAGTYSYAGSDSVRTSLVGRTNLCPRALLWKTRVVRPLPFARRPQCSYSFAIASGVTQWCGSTEEWCGSLYGVQTAAAATCPGGLSYASIYYNDGSEQYCGNTARTTTVTLRCGGAPGAAPAWSGPVSSSCSYTFTLTLDCSGNPAGAGTLCLPSASPSWLATQLAAHAPYTFSNVSVPLGTSVEATASRTPLSNSCVKPTPWWRGRQLAGGAA